MFVSSKFVAIVVNSNSKRAFWSNGSNYAGYREYTIDKLLEALELILYSISISSSMGVFSNKYLEYQWVVMLHLLLLTYTYHVVNIAT